MGPPSNQLPDEQTPETGGLTLSPAQAAELSQLLPEVQLASMRHIMETLLARVDTLQQNQAMQLAGVHDRLDAVELELPLIQEQSALRIRDLETRMSGEIEEAVRSATEEVAAGLQDQVAGKFGCLEAQIENQRNELAQMRESKKLTEGKLNRAILDIERLCADLAPRPLEAHHAAAETSASPFRTRVAEHIRKAAVEAAPDGSNPLVADAVGVRNQVSGASVGVVFHAPSIPKPPAPGSASTVSATRPSPAEHPVPGFEDWKRQFMESVEPPNPSMGSESQRKVKLVICPRCYSERTRTATPTRLDGIFRMAGFIPHRCRSCSYRFYKRGVPADELPLDGEARAEEALESR